MQKYLLELECGNNGCNDACKTELVPIPVRQKDIGQSMQQLEQQYCPKPLQEEWMMPVGSCYRDSQALGAVEATTQASSRTGGLPGCWGGGVGEVLPP